jgi:hypothetical protein
MAKVETKDLRKALRILTEGKRMKGASEFRLEAAAAQDEARPWTAGENIQGLGIAERITDGRKLDELALKVYVDRKLPKAKVTNLVPKKLDLPGMEMQVETDVEEIGKVVLEMHTGRFRPAMPGSGLGHLQVTVGTFGCLVRKKGTQSPLYILSNSHVLANQGVAAAKDPVVQAGVTDGGAMPDDHLCELAEWVPFQFTADDYPNTVDAAIAKVLRKKDVTSAVRLIGVPKGVSTVVRRGMQVRKSGRTTDLTIGEIKDVDYRLALNYKKPGGGTGRVGLTDQVLCTRYTDGGDSGSAVFNNDGKIVGLHFAGSTSSSIFNRIGNVLDALGIEVVTEEI